MASIADVVELAQRYRRHLQTLDTKAVMRLVQAYSMLFRRIQSDIDALVLAIERSEDISVAQIRKLAQYERLLTDVAEESKRYADYLDLELRQAVNNAAKIGVRDARNLVSLSVNNVRQIMDRWNTLNPDVIVQALGYFDPQGPLVRRLREFVPLSVERVQDTVIDSIARGRNPRVLARELERAFGINLTDALRLSRTAQIYAYREANRASYIANESIIQGWVWMSSLDTERTCMSCVALHGSFHKLSEPLNDHHNGLCYMIPKTIVTTGEIEPGERWFEQQSESVQRRMMGNAKFEAWRDGKIKINQLSHEQEDEIWGVIRTEVSLKSLMNEKSE